MKQMFTQRSRKLAWNEKVKIDRFGPGPYRQRKHAFSLRKDACYNPCNLRSGQEPPGPSAPTDMLPWTHAKPCYVGAEHRGPVGKARLRSREIPGSHPYLRPSRRCCFGPHPFYSLFTNHPYIRRWRRSSVFLRNVTTHQHDYTESQPRQKPWCE
jgi:hypothetical protein